MALVRCADCGTEVSDQAVACVRCGRPLRAPVPPLSQPDSSPRKKTSPTTWGCLILILLAVVGSYLTSTEPSRSGSQSSAPSEPTDDLDVFKSRYRTPDV